MTEIFGSEGVRDIAKQTVEQGYGFCLSQIETEQGLEPKSLNSEPLKPGDSGLLFKSIFIHDIKEEELNLFPSLLIMSDNINRVQPIEPEAYVHDPDDAPLAPSDKDRYLRVHGLLMHAFIIGQSEPDLSRARDRVELALWRTFYGIKVNPENCAIDRSSWQASYQDYGSIQGQGIITGLSIRFNMRVFEYIATPIRAMADTIETVVTAAS